MYKWNNPRLESVYIGVESLLQSAEKAISWDAFIDECGNDCSNLYASILSLRAEKEEENLGEFEKIHEVLKKIAKREDELRLRSEISMN